MKRLAALIFILSLLLIPASAHTQEEVYVFPIEFSALGSSMENSVSSLNLPQTGTFDPAEPTYGAQLKDSPLAVAAYAMLEEQLAPGVTELSLNVSEYGFTTQDWSGEVVSALNAAVAAFVYDHPESQYCTIGQYGYASSRGQITRVIYLITQQPDAEDQKSALENYLADFAADFDRTLPVEEQYRRIHDLVCHTLTYDYQAAAVGIPCDAHTVYGALVLNHTAVCEGYAKAFKALCDAVDLPCMLIIGEAQQSLVFSGRSNHMWNAVPIDGSWYAVDTTWDDETTFYNLEHLSITAIEYDYFLNNTPFLDDSPSQDHRSTGNIYFAGSFPMTFGLPELFSGSHPAAGQAPTAGSITFRGGTLSFPSHLWDMSFSNGFTPDLLKTVTLRVETSPVASATLVLPADRRFITRLTEADITRAAGFDGPIFSVSGSLTFEGDLTDPNLFTMADTAAVTLNGDLCTETFVMEQGTLVIHGELRSCVDYQGGTLIVNGDPITSGYHHFDPETGSCLCGQQVGCSHTFAEVIEDAFLSAPATCSSPALYFKSCSVCGEKSEETFFAGEAAPHSYIENPAEEALLTPATCTAPALYAKSCQFCGLIGEETFSHGEPAPHTGVPALQSPATCVAPATYCDICSVCGHQGEAYPSGELAPHTFAEVIEDTFLSAPATCSSPALYFKSCSVCGEKSEETFSSGEAAPHSYIENPVEESLLTPATCTAPALYAKSCQFCGLIGEETFSHGEPAPHTGVPTLHSPATCVAPATYCDICSVCGHQGEAYPSGELAPHTFAEVIEDAFLSAPATCSAPALYFKSCSVCGEKSEETFSAGEAAPHNYIENPVNETLLTPATCTAPALYAKSCQFCGLIGEETFSHGDPAPHTGVPALQSPATCVAPATYCDICSVCGHQGEAYPSGELAPHADADGDLHCDICSADLSDGSTGILALTDSTVTLRTESGISDILLCVAAYNADGRMTGIFFRSLTIEPGQLFTLDHTAVGDTFAAWILQPDTFAPLYSTK